MRFFLSCLIFFFIFALQNSVSAQMSGTYSIGASGNFSTFSQAVDSLVSQGISGNVDINVDYGTYNEQIKIPEIQGTSDTSKIIFQSSGQQKPLIQYSASQSLNYTISLDSADHIEFRNFEIKALNNNYGHVVTIQGEACYNKFTSNILTGINTGNTSDNLSVIFSGGNDDTNNTFDSNTIKYGSYGINISGSNSEFNNINNNIFEKQLVSAITLSLQKNSRIISNHITSASAYSQFIGIKIGSSFGKIKISKNKISFNSQGFPIFINSSVGDSLNNILISNNFIHAGGNSLACGIFIESSKRIDVFNNNINISNPSISSAGRGINIQNQNSVTERLYIKNNNIINAGTGFGLCTFTTNQIYSDYNNYYTPNGALGYWNGYSSNNLSTWNLYSGQDLHSIFKNPKYYSSSNLHISNYSLDSTAVPIALITHDIDNEVRNQTHFDIGADEITIISKDAGIVAITEPVSICTNDTTDIKIKLKNFGSDTLKTTSILLSINNNYKDTSLISASLLQFSDTVITLGQFVFSNATTYNIKIEVLKVNGQADTIHTNNIATKALNPGISGTYTISQTSGDFSSFGSAINYIQNNSICGAVTFEIDSGFYKEQINIPEIIGASSTNTITFKGNTNNNSDVILSYDANQWYANYTLKITGKHIRFENITLETKASTYATILQLGGHTSDIVFYKNKFISINTNSSSSNYTLVYCGNNNLYNSHITFDSNEFINGSYGIYLWGSNSTKDDNLKIKNNSFSNQYISGIYLYYQKNLDISSNKISTNTQNNNFKGINIFYGSDSMKISKNQITINNGGVGLSLYQSFGSQSNKGLISNNYIEINGYSSTAYGLYFYSSPFYNIFHNTIKITNTASGGRALFLAQGSGNLNINNNIFANLGGGYSIFSVQTSGVYSDNNDLYSTGTYLAYWNAPKQKLSDWQSASNQDNNSFSVDPVFKDKWHILSIELDSSGTTLPLISTDLDNESRNYIYPDIGADEYELSLFDAAIVSVPSFENIQCDGVIDVLVQIQNNGIVKLDSVEINLQINDSFIFYKAYLNLDYLKDTTLKITTYNFVADSNNLCIKLNLPNGNVDQCQENDSIFLSSLKLLPSPGYPIVVNDTICTGDTAILKVYSAKAEKYHWYDSSTNGTLLSQDSVFKISQLSESTSYYVDAGSKNKADSLATQFIQESGKMANGNMFDISALHSHIFIDSFDIHTQYKSNYIIWIYYKKGSFRGYQSDASAWTLLDSVSVMGKGENQATRIPTKGFTIPRGDTFGIYITSPQVSFLNFNSTPTVFSDNNIKIDSAIALDYPFNSLYSVSATWNGRVYYSTGSYCSSPRVPVYVNVIKAPDIQLPTDTFFCTGNNVVLKAEQNNSYSYQWKKLPSTTVISTMAELSVDKIAYYSLKISNSCGETDNKIIFVDGELNPITNFSVNDSSQCLSDNLYVFSNKTIFYDTSLLSYLWNFGDSSFSTVRNSNHSYLICDTFKVKLTSVSTKGCKDSSAITIKVNPVPKTDFLIVATSKCLNENSFNFLNNSTIKSGNLNSQWYIHDSFTSTNNDIFNLHFQSAGSFTISLETSSDFGCKDSMSKQIIVINNPKVELGNDSSLCENQHLLLFAGMNHDSVLWSNDSIDPIIRVDTNGLGTGSHNFWVKVTKGECSSYDSINIRFYDCVGIKETLTDNYFTVYPNPSTGNFTIKVSKKAIPLKLRIIDSQGKTIHFSNLEKAKTELNLSNLNKGLYFILLTNKENYFYKKMIVK